MKEEKLVNNLNSDDQSNVGNHRIRIVMIVILALLVFVISGVFLSYHLLAAGDNRKKLDNNVPRFTEQGWYIYPITSDSPEWKDYTVREKVEMLRIQRSVL